MYYDKRKNIVFKEKQEKFFESQININNNKNKTWYILQTYIRKTTNNKIKKHFVENYKYVNIKNLTILIFKLIEENGKDLRQKSRVAVMISGKNFTIRALFRFFSMKYQTFFIDYEPEDFQKIQSYLIYQYQEFQIYFYGPDL